jgi:hypothetical protein
MNSYHLARTIRIVAWRLRQKFRRYREAIAYAGDRLDTTLANDIIFNCQAAAGWYPLETLSIDSCLEIARELYWNDHPELESLVQTACARVASMWESTGHAADTAQNWALDLIPEYATAHGITLTPLPGDPAAEPSATPELTVSRAEIAPEKPG